jgi:hypothetical protein
MKGVFIALILASSVVGGGLFLRQKGISLPNIKLPGRDNSAEVAMNSIGSGQVLGDQAPPLAISHFADRFAGVGKVLGSLVSSIGVQTAKTSETLVKNATTNPTSPEEVIDMSKVVKDISTKIESIPGNLVNQAKVEYCRQVLENATASASTQ